MTKSHELAFDKQDIMRAFKILAGDKDPDGLITPEVLEKALVGGCTCTDDRLLVPPSAAASAAAFSCCCLALLLPPTEALYHFFCSRGALRTVEWPSYPPTCTILCLHHSCSLTRTCSPPRLRLNHPVATHLHHSISTLSLAAEALCQQGARGGDPAVDAWLGDDGGRVLQLRTKGVEHVWTPAL